jgi:hypothetical protein
MQGYRKNKFRDKYPGRVAGSGIKKEPLSGSFNFEKQGHLFGSQTFHRIPQRRPDYLQANQQNGQDTE